MTTVSIAAGTLSLAIHKNEHRLNELLDFASRENPKRGFLFVSKVLGKYIPCKPSVMRQNYDELAEHIGVSNDATFVVGMAETATGLGAGVADSLASISNSAVIYQHTTRYALNHPRWLEIDESHSHAPDHILYEPKDELKIDIEQSTRLVLVDDEITTGRTLLLLGEKLLKKMPQAKELIIVSPVSWLSEEGKAAYQTLGLPVRFIHLIEGEFSFDKHSHFNPKLPSNVDKHIRKEPVSYDNGRLAVRMPAQSQSIQIEGDKEGQVAIIGTGEYMFEPFLIAENLEKQGVDVVFQSTGRSPILVGNAIENKLAFSDVGSDVEHYIYNLSPNRVPIVVCESSQLAAKNGLVKLVQEGVNNAA